MCVALWCNALCNNAPSLFHPHLHARQTHRLSEETVRHNNREGTSTLADGTYTQGLQIYNKKSMLTLTKNSWRTFGGGGAFALLHSPPLEIYQALYQVSHGRPFYFKLTSSVSRVRLSYATQLGLHTPSPHPHPPHPTPTEELSEYSTDTNKSR